MYPLAKSRRLLIRCAFAAVVLWCGLQYGVTTLMGEPYPALCMPAFHGSGGYHEGEVTVRTAEAFFVFADGGSASFSMHALLEPIPGSHHAALAEIFFSPLMQDATATRCVAAPTRLTNACLPGLYAGARNRRSAANQDAVRAWLACRAAQLTPAKKVRQVEVRWYRETLRSEGERIVRRARVADGVLAIPLEGGSDGTP